MASIQLSGLASGFDWKSFVDQVMDLNAAPITRLKTEQTTNTSKTNSLNTLAAKLGELQTASKALQANGLFNGRASTSTTTNSQWSTSASSGTATGTYSFAVSRLATQSKQTGTTDIGLGISATDNVSGLTLASMRTATAVTAGIFTVNGAQVTIATTDSLDDVFTKISTATGGNVTASYATGTDKITLAATTGNVVLGASNDTSNFLSVARLANNDSGSVSSSSGIGSTSQTLPLASAGLRTTLTGSGTFTINGTSIAYDATTDSLNGIIDRINGSAAGVTASYNSTEDRMVLTNKTTGDLGITLSESPAGLLGALGLSGGTLTRGLNAQYTVNGSSTLTSTTNTFDASSHGITGLSVTANSETTESISVTSNTSSMRTAIDTFISSFNAVQSYIDDQTKITSANGKVTASLMSNNREIQAWSSTLRATAFAAVSGVSGTIQRLENLGIDFTSGTSQLAVKDSTKLTAALRDHPSDVESFFKTASTGFAARFDTFATAILGSSGTGLGGELGRQKETLLKGNTSIDLQIATIQRQLASERSRLEAGFIAMEQAQATIQQMQKQLTSAFSSNSS